MQIPVKFQFSIFIGSEDTVVLVILVRPQNGRNFTLLYFLKALIEPRTPVAQMVI